MNILNIIDKKKNKKILNREEINFAVSKYTSGEIKDYQMSSLLMAILLNGMNEEEVFNLTMAMISSGDTIDLSSIPGKKSDKHSTGGVGDKVSIALLPLVGACGVKMAKMSGKGLAHTGGTLDKLESIPGFRIELSQEEFVNHVEKIGISIISQTENLVPADKLLYALRDVTSTVDSIPLIASSIMSKKLASGADTILLDVKCGKGAFMKDLDSAIELGNTMVDIGENAKRNTQVVISNMDEPLGYAIGNSLEVIEAIETLKGNGPEDFLELILQEGIIILNQNGVEKDSNKARELLLKAIENGSALEKLKGLITFQGGDENVVDDYSLLPIGKYKTEIKSPRDGFIKSMDSLKLGLISADLGAGRKAVGDKINYGTGILLNKKTSDKISKGELLLTLYHDGELPKNIEEDILNSIEFSDTIVDKKKLIYEHIYRR